MSSPPIILPVGTNFRDIPELPRAYYTVDVPWDSIERQIETEKQAGLDLEPEYQREHKWTIEQRIAFVEYVMRGGEASTRITFVTTDRLGMPLPNYSLLDGKQRLESVRMFMRDELRAFGLLRSEFIGKPRGIWLKWHIVAVPTVADIYRLYLALNEGGTVHTPQELGHVHALLAAEEERVAQKKMGLYTCYLPVPASIAAMHTGARIVAATPLADTGDASVAQWHGPGATKPGMGHMMVLACGCVVTSDIADKPCAQCNPPAPPLKLYRLTFGQQAVLRGLTLRPGGMVILRGGGSECADPGVAAKLVKLDLAYKDAEMLNGVVIRERLVITEKGKTLLDKGSA